MIERDPVGNDGRARHRIARLGLNSACARCSYLDPAALLAVNRTTLEEHHPAGRKNDPKWTIILCRNCHAELTELNMKYGVSMKEPNDDLERVQNRVRGMGVMLTDAGQQLDECSELIDKYRKDGENGPQKPKSRSSSVHKKKQNKTKPGGPKQASGSKSSETKKRTRIRRRDDD